MFVELHQFLEAARPAGTIVTELGAELQSLPGRAPFFLITCHFHDGCGEVTQ